MELLGYRAFATELLKIATEVRDADIRAMISEAKGKEYGSALRTNTEVETSFKPKIAMGFMGYTPPSTYNFRGKAPTGKSTPYETTSNFAATGLRGAMTGAGAGTLLHTLRRGHDLKMAPSTLGKWVAGGAGIALADRTLRRHQVMKQQKLNKTAMMGSQSFTPARALQTGQQQGHFENKMHRGVVKPTPGLIGREPRLPQGA